MSPRKTFQSWGSSSMENRRMNAPTRDPGVSCHLEQHARALVLCLQFGLAGLGVDDHGTHLEATRLLAAPADPGLREEDGPAVLGLMRSATTSMMGAAISSRMSSRAGRRTAWPSARPSSPAAARRRRAGARRRGEVASRFALMSVTAGATIICVECSSRSQAMRLKCWLSEGAPRRRSPSLPLRSGRDLRRRSRDPGF